MRAVFVVFCYDLCYNKTDQKNFQRCAMENQFYSMLSRMKLISRWGLMRNTFSENISEHSLETAMLAHCLAVIRNTYFDGNVNAERCALLGIFHDVTEIITGDLPTPVKYGSSEIRSAYREVEDNAKDRMIKMLPKEMQPQFRPLLSPEADCSEEEKELWRLVKAADKLSALIKCIEERSMGNSDFVSAERSSLQSLKDMKLPEVDHFIGNFLPSYGKTLDEQTK